MMRLPHKHVVQGQAWKKKWYQVPSPYRFAAYNLYRRNGRKNSRSGGYIGKEHKFLDTEVDSVSLVQTVAGAETDPSTINCLNAMAQGDGESQRGGRMCYFTSLQIRGWVLFQASASATSPSVPGYVRILIVRDKQSNGATYNSEDVLQAPSSSNVASEALRNLQYLQRFTVLKDITVKQSIYSGVGTATDSDWCAQQVPWKCNIKLNMKTLFTGTTGTIANIVDNSLHVMAIYQGSTVPTMGYFARVRYYT